MRAENPFQCPCCHTRIFGFDELVEDESGEVLGCINCYDYRHAQVMGSCLGADFGSGYCDGGMDRSSLAEFIPKWI